MTMIEGTVNHTNGNGNLRQGAVSEYAPPNSDPVRLAGITVRAVDQIGDCCAEELEKAAEEVMAGAKKVADELRELALAVRDHSREQAKALSTYCDTAVDVLGNARDMRTKLGLAPQTEDNLPAIAKKGPAVRSDG
jgi:hypothetical protein